MRQVVPLGRISTQPWDFGQSDRMAAKSHPAGGTRNVTFVTLPRGRVLAQHPPEGAPI
jgi:hypothetical protein